MNSLDLLKEEIRKELCREALREWDEGFDAAMRMVLRWIDSHKELNGI